MVEALECNIYAIYGDRGTDNLKKVLLEMNWSQRITEKVTIQTISNTCHFPMLENREEFKNVLDSVL